MKTLERFGPPALLILVSLGIAYFFGNAVTERTLTGLESFLWQFFTLLIGLTGSFFFGRQSAQEAAKEIIKTQARPAFRQLLSLRSGFLQQSFLVELSQESESREDYKIIFSELAGLIYMQQLMVGDALGGWEDVVPEEVAKLKERLSADNTTEDGQ